MNWIALFVGGGLGACLRAVLAGAVDGRTAGTVVAGLPLGIGLVNLSGCFAIGLLATLADEQGWLDTTWRAFAVAGLLGGFTTFSTFGLDTVRLAAEGRIAMAATNVLGSVALSLVAVVLGIWAARSGV